jgi:hypothetical protein
MVKKFLRERSRFRPTFFFSFFPPFLLGSVGGWNGRRARGMPVKKKIGVYIREVIFDLGTDKPRVWVRLCHLVGRFGGSCRAPGRGGVAAGVVADCGKVGSGLGAAAGRGDGGAALFGTTSEGNIGADAIGRVGSGFVMAVAEHESDDA